MVTTSNAPQVGEPGRKRRVYTELDIRLGLIPEELRQEAIRRVAPVFTKIALRHLREEQQRQLKSAGD